MNKIAKKTKKMKRKKRKKLMVFCLGTLGNQLTPFLGKLTDKQLTAIIIVLMYFIATSYFNTEE